MGEDTKNNNVYDFVAYRLERLMDEHLARGDVQNAEALLDALDAYLAGLVTVSFIEGRTYITPITDNAEDENKNNV